MKQRLLRAKEIREILASLMEVGKWEVVYCSVLYNLKFVSRAWVLEVKNPAYF